MSLNVGEELVAAYLEHIKGCNFIQQNLYTPDVQGEIDVVGINLDSKTIFVCEVAIHLVTGLQYTKDNRPNNVNKLTEKYSRDIEYANKYFPDYQKQFMLWTPIIRIPKPTAKNNQLRDIEQIRANILSTYNVELDCIFNHRFLECLREMRQYANRETKNLNSPILRYLQIEEYLTRHVDKISTSEHKYRSPE